MTILFELYFRCKDNVTFEVSKKILWKIIQRHMVCFKPAMAFFAVNIDIEDERGKLFYVVKKCEKMNDPPGLQSYVPITGGRGGSTVFNLGGWIY